MGKLESVDCESKWQSCSCFTKEIPDSDGLEESHLLMFQNNEGKSPQPPFIKGGNVVASLGKGGGTEVPEGLRKFTLTRIAKFTKFIKQFNPLTKRGINPSHAGIEGKTSIHS